MASYGYIVTQVYTARQVVPVSDASVMVVQRNGDKDNLIGFRLTDSDGRTQPIEVETPNVSFAQEPGTVQPFSTFDIHVEHPNYYPVTIVNAQVFAGITTEQRVEMIPVANDVPDNTDENIERIYVTPQNL